MLLHLCCTFAVNHYKCMYCDMTCPTPSALQLHVAYRHSDSKPHACMYCEYRLVFVLSIVKNILIKL